MNKILILLEGGKMDSCCPNCNSKFFPEDVYCGNCGNRLNEQKIVFGATQQALKASDIQFKLGVVYFKKKEFPKAVELFTKILEQEPTHTQALEMLEAAKNAETLEKK
jgi:lipopolysaccharide biosynthesis regulator YciM